MGRKKKDDGGHVTAIEKKRKAVKTKRIEREHAGKVVAPFALIEKLVKKLHPDLEKATFVLFWRKGWRPDADGVLTAAKIKKASEVDKELSDFDFAIFLNFELWNETKISEEHKTIVIDRELCHARPEVDRDGEQKKDDRGRLCWRLRKFEITEFTEIIHRYGLEKVTGISSELIAALDDEKAKTEVAAETNDEKRPLLTKPQRVDEGANGRDADPDAWKKKKISELKKYLTEKAFDALEATPLHTLGDLSERMTRSGDFWHQDIGIHGRFKEPINEAFRRFHLDAV